MKKITIFTTVICLFMHLGSKAQDTIGLSSHNIHAELSIGRQQYGLVHSGFTLELGFLFDASPRCSIGLGGHVGILCDRGEAVSLNSGTPFNRFNISASQFGFMITSSYHLKKGYVMLDGLLIFNNVSVSAQDDRCAIEVYDENNTTSCYSIDRIDRERWYEKETCSIQISYLLPVTSFFGVKFTTGYYFTPIVNIKALSQDTEVYSSDWSEFQEYYGHPTVNLYESFESVRSICNAKKFYFVISLSLFH